MPHVAPALHLAAVPITSRPLSPSLQPTSYYFIATFIEQHINHHAAALKE